MKNMGLVHYKKNKQETPSAVRDKGNFARGIYWVLESDGD